MRDTSFTFDLGRRDSKIHREYKIPLVAFICITILTLSPIKGQENNGIGAHIENNSLFLELDERIFDIPILFVRHPSRQLQVEWSRVGNSLLLTQKRIKAFDGTLMAIDDDVTVNERIIGQFPIIQNKSKGNFFVIDATELFLSLEIKWFKYYTQETVLPHLSYIKDVEILGRETIIRTKRTILVDGKTKTVTVDFSFYTLPVLMRPRLVDHRMGFILDNEWDFRRVGNYHANIRRWRLEKKHPGRLLSEPKNPIKFYLDPKIPRKWVPYITAGVLEWLPAFKAAGFEKAIEVKELPDSIPIEPSVNYSIIRWANLTGVRGPEVEMGSTVKKVTDLRTGEILKADILIKSTFQSLSDNYFIRCAPLDPRAQKYPFSDDLVGELLQSVVAHEAGHAFGIMDANFGEFGYPFEKMRDIDWLNKMGHTPSVMNYSRHNYIAQPEDSIPPKLLIPRVGPMDIQQIRWGYTIFPNALKPEDELSFLNDIIMEKDSLAWFHFNSDYFGIIGPGNTHEVVECRDPIRSTELGIRNIERVIELLPKLNKDKRDNDLLDRIYEKTLDFWFLQMKQVVSLVGGTTIHFKAGFQEGDVFESIAKKEQLKAIEFLCQNAFIVPDWLWSPDFIGRLKFSSGKDKLMVHQLNLLSEILSVNRMKRLEFMYDKPIDDEFPEILFKELQLGLFEELINPNIEISIRRKELQNAYISLLADYLENEINYSFIKYKEWGMTPSQSSKSLYFLNMQNLQNLIKSSFKDIKSDLDKKHLELCLEKVDAILLRQF